MLAGVAVRLLSATLRARRRPESGKAAASLGPERLALLEKKLGRPQGGWTHRNGIVAPARLGGLLARKHAGMPGGQTLWRGWPRLMGLCEGANLIEG